MRWTPAVRVPTSRPCFVNDRPSPARQTRLDPKPPQSPTHSTPESRSSQWPVGARPTQTAQQCFCKLRESSSKVVEPFVGLGDCQELAARRHEHPYIGVVSKSDGHGTLERGPALDPLDVPLRIFRLGSELNIACGGLNALTGLPV